MMEADISKQKQQKVPRFIGRVDIALGDLRCVNERCLPVVYDDSFYKAVSNMGKTVRVAYFNDLLVGGMISRRNIADGCAQLVLMTLSVLEPYQRCGIGTLLMEYVFELCEQDYDIKSICLHVQINNTAALDFYKKFGFEVVETKEKYYKNVQPDAAYALEKRVNSL